MGRAIVITRQYDAGALRKLARRERDGRVASRLLAIASVLDGVNRTDAARQAGMERQTLRDWVHRFNADGPAGLRNKAHGRPVRRLAAAQEAEIKTRVHAGPDPQTDRLVRWRCTDLQNYIAQTCKVDYHVRSIGSQSRCHPPCTCARRTARNPGARRSPRRPERHAGLYLGREEQTPARSTLRLRLHHLRQNALANRCFENYDAIVQACCKSWNDLIALPETIKSIASREWFECVKS